MKVLMLYDYPPSPAGLATQGHLLHRGLEQMGVDVHSVDFESDQEKEWYYRWFKPDIVVGVGYWGHTPYLVQHPQEHGIQPVPWLVADGYMANYHKVLDKLPLILVTSRWVKDVYIRDGLSGKNIEVLPVGCDTDCFVPRDKNDPKVSVVREALGVAPEEIMILTIGGDATSKGAQEVMHALALNAAKIPKGWKYVCKVWPQPRTEAQNEMDMQLATQLGISKNIIYTTGVMSRNFIPYLLAACDIYAAPSRLEGFGMTQVEASACGKPVIGIKAMGMLDTMVHEETALLAEVAQEVHIKETIVGDEAGYGPRHRHVFKEPRIVDYRASIHDIADYLVSLMTDAKLRKRMGEAGRKRVVENYDYRVVAKRFIEIISEKLGVS
jgi:glycosyltransferase involved in cell wall biosynthesis